VNAVAEGDVAAGVAAEVEAVRAGEPGRVHAQDRRVLIRDTKDRQGPVLAFNPQSWRNFTAKVKAQRS
jgi:hypothetical protein